MEDKVQSQLFADVYIFSLSYKSHSARIPFIDRIQTFLFMENVLQQLEGWQILSGEWREEKMFGVFITADIKVSACICHVKQMEHFDIV